MDLVPDSYIFNPGLDRGVHSFNLILRLAGDRAILVIDTSDSRIKNTVRVAVTPGAPARLSFQNLPESNVAGNLIPGIKLSVEDAFGNLVASFAGATILTSTDSRAIIPGEIAFTGGSAIFSATFLTAGAANLRAVSGDLSGTSARVQVLPAVLNVLSLSPTSVAIAAGGSQQFTATGFDRYNNPLGDVTATTALVIAPDGSCTGSTCTATNAGVHTITGTNSGRIATISMIVNPGTLNRIVLSSASSAISAGESIAFRAIGFDFYSNSLGDVAATTALSIAPDGSCTGTTCTATKAGLHTITGTNGDKVATVSFMVNPGALNSVVLSPASSTILAGGSQLFTANGFDLYNNPLGDMAAATVLSIAPDGSCSGMTCSATKAGAHSISAANMGKVTTASLMINPETLNTLVLSAASSAISAGESLSITASGFDRHNNPLGDVAAATALSIAPDGSCAGLTCTATKAGRHTITGTNGGRVASISLNVNPGALNSIALSPANSAISAGASQAFTASGFDRYNNPLGDVAAVTRFSISPDGLCSNANCSATSAGIHTVTATSGGISVQSTLMVNAGALNAIVISPANASISAGGNQAFTATGIDRYNNPLGDVTSATMFSMVPDGSCVNSTCSATTAGLHTVTGTNNGRSTTASLNVTAGALSSMTLNPPSASISAGGNQVFKANGFDRYNNPLGDVTAAAKFSIAPDGLCSNANCSATSAGIHAVTAISGGISAQSALIVNAGALNAIAISPANASISAGGNQTFTATGIDRYNNPLGDVTSGTVFSLTPDGSCVNATCSATTAGLHTVTGTNNGRSATASLNVNASALSSIVLSPANATIGSGGSQVYTAGGFDRYNNPLGDVTASTQFSIAPDGSCVNSIRSATTIGLLVVATNSGSICTASASGLHTVTGVIGNISAQAFLRIDPPPAVALQIPEITGPIVEGTKISLVVSARDRFGNIAVGYRGTVHFSSADKNINLPKDYTFVESDAGIHRFEILETGSSKDSVTITVVDINSTAVAAAQTVLRIEDDDKTGS